VVNELKEQLSEAQEMASLIKASHNVALGSLHKRLVGTEAELVETSQTYKTLVNVRGGFHQGELYS
jgi:hypothetical protein